MCKNQNRKKRNRVTEIENQTDSNRIWKSKPTQPHFSTYDFSKGYWQVPMSDEDKAFTAFVTHKGLHQFKVMPFGLVNAPASFNRIMRKLLYGNEHLDNYVDNVLEHTPTWQEHLSSMRDFLVE